MKPFCTLTALALMVAAVGCATSSSTSEPDRIMATVEKWKTAVVEKDVDALEPLYSEQYSGSNASSKEAAMAFVRDVISQGALDNAAIGADDAKLSIDGYSAEYGPLDLTAQGGTFTINLTLGKESGRWLITNVATY